MHASTPCPSPQQPAAGTEHASAPAPLAQAPSTSFAAALLHLGTTLHAVAAVIETRLRRPEVQRGIGRALRGLQHTQDRINAIEAPGYVPYFERLGHSPFQARFYVGMVRYFAATFYKEYQDKRVALSALHDLAKRPRWHPALARQVAQLRDHCGSADFLDDACRRAGDPGLKDTLLDLLQRTRENDASCGPRLIAVVALIAPHAPSSRGRSVRFETVLHQVFLQWSAHAGGRQGYTYDMDRNDFTDAATTATRDELRRPTFTPVAARSAERKKRARKAKMSRSKS